MLELDRCECSTCLKRSATIDRYVLAMREVLLKVDESGSIKEYIKLLDDMKNELL
jgi:transcriptional regulator NrdR family protein